MKKKKRASGARKRLGTTTPESECSEQSFPYQEPTAKGLMHTGTSQENSMKQDIPLLSLSRADGLQPGFLTPIEGPLHPSNLKESPSCPLSAMLSTCHRGDPNGTDSEGSSSLHVTTFADITQTPSVDQIRDRYMECSPCITLLNLPESGICETCPAPIHKCQTTDSSRLVGRSLMEHPTSETSDGNFLCVNGMSIEDDGRDCCQSGYVREVIGTCSEWTAAVTSLSRSHTKHSCLEGDNSPAQDLSPDLSAVPDVQVQVPRITELNKCTPETISPIQTDKSQPDTQGIKSTSCFSDWGDNLPEQDLGCSQDQKSESAVLLSPKGERNAIKDPARICKGDTTSIYEGDPAPPCEGDPAPICKGDTTPIYEGDPAPICKGDTTSIYEGDPAPPCEGDPAPICKGDTTPIYEGDSAPICKGDTIPIYEGDPAPRCEGDPAPICKGDTTPIYEGRPTPPCEGDPAPPCEGEGDPAPPCERDPSLPCEGEGDPAPPCERDPASPCEGDPDPPCKGERDSPHGDPTSPRKEDSAHPCDRDPAPLWDGDPAPPCEGRPVPPCDRDPAPPCEGDSILAQGIDSVLEDSRGPATDLDVPDSQLLGALEESFFEPGQNVYDTVTYRGPSASGNPAKLQDDTAQPTLRMTPALAEAPRGEPERRGEDASSTVQGLITELSNLNRLIMTTYRELRQKRVRFPPGRGAASGKRRREM